ncbi:MULTISPECIES: cysteine desulfurase family protein [unclassified Corynebacterium]|uniref:cysteine desulfurase family protein n=2 Tax=Corynebacterium TaxID=1716 RepID=UPI002653BA1B|nr:MULTISPECIES: cysteine desulfurase family protein [unclassified Corynebacterium]MDN8594469.1 cysteine desulfurase family protein [Corynebacterium sp. P4_F2]WKK64466.1 cysteine desulfurase family protein [Corynebacterium sp. P8-C1]
MSGTRYFDHAATTPMRQVAVDAWAEHAHLLNPGGQYASGRAANAAVAQARETVAELLGADPVEVIFTASGTEADNLSLRGFAGEPGARIVATPIEHPAVRETVADLEQHGAQVDMLPVGGDGVVRVTDILDQPAAVATCMWANNETGAVQPVDEVVRRADAAGTPVHVDAVQVVGHLPVDFHALGATTLAASAHKFGGPRGAGILLAKRSPAPAAVLTGGGQQRGIRPGTVDVATAVATAAALKEAVADMETERARLVTLRDRLVAEVLRTIPDARATVLEHGVPTLPGHAHLMFPGANGDAMIMLLDSMGIEASTGSACNNGVNQRSHVLEAMGLPDEHVDGALRFTLGRTTTDEDVQFLLARLPEVIGRARDVAKL